MKNALTEKQKEILDFIKNDTTVKGYPPTIREISEAVGLKSTASVKYQLDALEKSGYITRDKDKPRAIIVLNGSQLEPLQYVRKEPGTEPGSFRFIFANNNGEYDVPYTAIVQCLAEMGADISLPQQA